MRPILSRIALCLLAFAAAVPASAAECGDPEGECPVATRFYRLAMPADAVGPVPALMFLHGWSGSSAGAMARPAMRDVALARGYAVIAPEGLPNSETRPQKNWAVRDGTDYGRDDIAFLTDVLADAATRGVDRQRILLAGFSRGGSMVWDVACHAPGMARAYAPVAGAFWEPLPQKCAAGVDLFHTHGWADKVVPLEGRSVAGGTITQGDTFASLDMLRATNGCQIAQPDVATADEDGIWRRTWNECPGGAIELMLHPGVHGTPKRWLEDALNWFETRLAED